MASFILAYFKDTNNQKKRSAVTRTGSFPKNRATDLQGKEEHPESFQPEKEDSLFLEPEALDNIQLDEG